jgi:hypothetical protein
MTMLFDLCLSVVVTLHLLVVGLAGWAPLACWWLEWRATRRGDALAGGLSRRLAGQSMTALAIGMALGGVMLWLLWLRHGGAYFERYRIVPPSRLWFGVAELAFFFVCMALYRSTWHWFAGRRFWHRALAVAAASDLLYHFPPLFTAVTVVAARPELAAERPRFVSLLIEPEVLTRTFHHWLAGLAVTGVYVAWMALRTRDVTVSDPMVSDALVGNAPVSHADIPAEPRESDGMERARTRLAAGGGRWALAATALQLPVGIWLLTVLPRVERSALLGGSPWTAICFAGGLVAVMILLHHLAALAIGGGGPREALRVARVLAQTMLLMVATRQRAKGEMTDRAGNTRIDTAQCTPGKRIAERLIQTVAKAPQDIP